MADTKIDSATAELTRTVPAQEQKFKYRIEDLEVQKASIIAQRAREITARNAEIAEVDELISRCKAVGVVPVSIKDVEVNP